MDKLDKKTIEIIEKILKYLENLDDGMNLDDVEFHDINKSKRLLN